MASVVRPFSGTFEIDRPHSTVQFAVGHIVSTFRATFEGIEGMLVADGR